MFPFHTPENTRKPKNFSVFSRVKTRNIALYEKCPYSEFSGPYFPTFGLNTKRYSVSLRIQSEHGKIGPEKL